MQLFSNYKIVYKYHKYTESIENIFKHHRWNDRIKGPLEDICKKLGITLYLIQNNAITASSFSLESLQRVNL